MQIREKDLEPSAFQKEALELKALCAKYQVPFVVNDSVEIALAIDADGVHVGQGDIQGKNLRALIGKDKILGISAATVAEAVAAQAAGADYIGVGAVFGTSTKKNARNLSVEKLREICAAVTIPVVAIGGIHALNLRKLFRQSGRRRCCDLCDILLGQPGKSDLRPTKLSQTASTTYPSPDEDGAFHRRQ